MKKILLFPLFTLCFLAVNAQLPNNSIGPDFTANDIEGNTHNLYAYLDSGYTVVLDLSAAWCGPCWTVHQTGLLQDIHDQYGPDGTNEMRVFYIESEGANTEDQLYGIGTNGGGANPATDTHGDWVANHTFPFIDNASIANAYQLSAFPTIFAISPNRLTTVFVGSPAPSVADFYDLHQNSVGPATTAIDPLMMEYSGESTSLCGSLNAAVKIQNHGTNALTSLTVDLIQNGGVIATENWTGNAASYSLFDVEFDNIVIPKLGNILIKRYDSDSIVETIPALSGKVTGANVSVRITDDFMKSV